MSGEVLHQAQHGFLSDNGAVDLRENYRRTEAGIIPIDWEVKRLYQLVEFLDGQRRPVKSADRAKMSGDYPYYGASGIVDYVNDYLFDEELILLGEDGENILSRNTRLAFRVSGKIWINNHAHVLRPNRSVDITYLAEYLESLEYDQYNSGTAQPKLNKRTCQHIPVAIPPFHEQEAIAAALSDVDRLLAALDTLIVKIRAIKKATMQQLLSGQTRLAGYGRKWEMKQLGQLAEIKGGATPNTQIHQFWNGTIPWCTPTDITRTPSKYLATTERRITSEGMRACAASLLPRGSLLLCSRATIGEVKIASTEICTNQGFKSLICKPGVSNEFLYYLLLTLKQQMIERAIGSTFLEIGKRELAAISVLFPEEPEQVAIAAVLSDMDDEIAALEARREKTHAIKQAMMQQLLTGRIRLVKPETSEATP